ncbi:MAG: hypothetical protein AMXMBFR46_13810 [Acidimicrobiia bacterium]
MPEPATPEDRALVEQLDEVWTRIAHLGGTLSEDDWKRATEVPGWTVQDNLTHLSDIESMTMGIPPPDHAVPAGLTHVKNDLGARNEVFVDARRSWAGADALAEFVEVTGARLTQLRGFTTADFDAESWTPMGPGTVRDLLPFRAFDSWVHEQDMRRAVGRPGGLEGPAAEAAMDRIVATAGFVIGKKVAPPDGTVVVIECTPPLARTVAIVVDAGRARPHDGAAGGTVEPTVRLALDGETYARLACGRLDPEAALAAGSVAIDGDTALGRRVLDALDFLF